ncbi:hypothetical protein Bca4012_058520 [Brassica carinata]
MVVHGETDSELFEWDILRKKIGFDRMLLLTRKADPNPALDAKEKSKESIYEKGQTHRHEDSKLISEAAAHLNKFSNDGRFMKEMLLSRRMNQWRLYRLAEIRNNME